MITRRQFKKLSFFTLASGLTNCSYPFAYRNSIPKNSQQNSDLVILWERGYLPEENRGILELVDEWQKISGQKINLKLVADDFIERELTGIANNPRKAANANIIFSVTFNHNLAPILAWQDRLVDLSVVIEPLVASFNPTVLSQIHYRSHSNPRLSYYSLPIGQSDAYVHYWKNLLTEVKYSEKDIPADWLGFWEFWKAAHRQLKSQQHPEIYGLGISMSASGFDTSAAFQLFLEAYNVQVVDDSGNFVLATADNHQRFVAAIHQFTELYRQKYVPPEAIEWSGSGNNINFLNCRNLMTVNMTLSIPSTQNLVINPYNSDANQRYQQIGTLATFPQKIDGTNLNVPKVINQILVLKKENASHDPLKFLQYLARPENIQRLTNSFSGRILPIMPQHFQDSRWQNPNDSHIQAALQIYRRPSLTKNALHPVLGQIYSQQIWAQTILQVIHQKATSAMAANWSIAQISQLWKQMEKRP